MPTALIIALLLLSILPRTASPQHHMVLPPERPRLVVLLVVCQMRHDHLHHFAHRFGAEGFNLLAAEGTVCRNARFNHMLTQPHPGVATISTGATPSVHGIVSNQWYSRATGAEVPSVADDRVSTVGGSFFSGKFSPRNLITSTLGDELRMASPSSRVFGIALEPGHAILSSGHNANGAFWFDTERGHWVTSSHYMSSLPAWADTFNAKGFAELYLHREWALQRPLGSYGEADTAAVTDSKARGRLRAKLSSLVQGIVPRRRRAKDFSPLLENPYGNTLTKDFAIATIVGENLGRGNHTDLVAISFTPTRAIGQQYGPHSIEMEDALIRLDAELAHFIRFLNSEIGRQNYLLVFTSDHGVASSPSHLEQSRIPGGYFEPHQATALLGSYLNIVFGAGKWVTAYHDKQIYLNRRLIEDSNLSLPEFQQRVAQFMLQFTGVANATTATTLQSSNFSSGILAKFQNSFNQRRSGDVIINLEPGWVERRGSSLTSANSPYSYDTHVPLIWYGWKARRRQVLAPVCMTDLAPTLSTLLGIGWPNGSIGQPIRELIE